MSWADRSIKPGVPLVITNAIYFKGAWAHAFKKSSTQDQDFHLLGNAGTKTVKMMEQNKLKTRHGSFADHAMVQLPYKGQDIVMLIMLPHENSSSALQAVRMRCLVWCGMFGNADSLHHGAGGVGGESEEDQPQPALDAAVRGQHQAASLQV